jgi:hypothetical protein
MERPPWDALQSRKFRVSKIGRVEVVRDTALAELSPTDFRLSD